MHKIIYLVQCERCEPASTFVAVSGSVGVPDGHSTVGVVVPVQLVVLELGDDPGLGEPGDHVADHRRVVAILLQSEHGVEVAQALIHDVQVSVARSEELSKTRPMRNKFKN